MTLLCCMPFGIAAIVYSVLTMGDKNNGRFDSAMKNSKMAKTMLVIGIIGWAVCMVFYVGLVVYLVINDPEALENL